MKKMLSSISIDFEFVVDDCFGTDDVCKMLYKDVGKYIDVGLWCVGIEKYRGDIKVKYNENYKDDNLQHILMEEKKRS